MLYPKSWTFSRVSYKPGPSLTDDSRRIKCCVTPSEVDSLNTLFYQYVTGRRTTSEIPEYGLEPDEPVYRDSNGTERTRGNGPKSSCILLCPSVLLSCERIRPFNSAETHPSKGLRARDGVDSLQDYPRYHLQSTSLRINGQLILS